MNSMGAGGYKNANVANPRGGYRSLFVVITLFFYHKGGYYVRQNKVTFKYLNFKKDVDLDVHVKVFNFVIKKNAETFEKISSIHLVIC